MPIREGRLQTYCVAPAKWRHHKAVDPLGEGQPTKYGDHFTSHPHIGHAISEGMTGMLV